MEAILFDYGVAIAASIPQAVALTVFHLMTLPGASQEKVLVLMEEWEFTLIPPGEIDRDTATALDKGKATIHLFSFEF